ncbi:hypothetical protein CANARDRAFT_27506 [[Candida] arabinofermentans NRRL YB-2248]|uniref:Uncharacterized protein n=1 Tax=[Candida] arabinofermentans NRRL YB-2248 TaxID=983967 RepID=A0A1E4T3C1_9ASCO|nr:hypothetical protein CANARDRAFT_27506 [[Candida] arabinofermentans NRRL YB-2248]
MLRSISKSVKPVLRVPLATKRGFSLTIAKMALTPFGMPAMSPTMEEGGIVSWKVKEGDSFSAGDELLEVETDKATISVEAQDDGIMAKIIKHDGEKEIKVGFPIAYLAEPGDNIAELEIPSAEEPVKAPEPAAAAAPKAPKASEPEAAPAKKESTSTPKASQSSGAADQSQVFFPSVSMLLDINHISREEALSKIPATGPKGRILKGDVLAYLGQIPADSNSKIASYIKSKEHLDLSNIELRPKVDSKAAETSPEKVEKKQKEPVKVTHQFVLASSIPKESISKLIAKASKSAEIYAYGTPLYQPSDLIDPIFEELVAPPRNSERFTVSTTIGTLEEPAAAIVDDFDFEPFQESSSSSDVLTTVDVELVCNEKVFDSKARAEKYIERFGDYLKHAESKLAL